MFFDIGVRSLYLTISRLRLRLEQSIKEENKSYIKFLESVNFDILDLKKKNGKRYCRQRRRRHVVAKNG